MRSKTESEIIKVLEENKENNEELEALAIAGRIGLSYDTTAKHLKRMAEEGILIREARGAGIDKNTGRRLPWNYYYTLNKNYQQK
jgi:Mn-dependent DtxR family transcriptional regulator